MKILVSAYACETGRGSEGEIGWRLVHELAQEHDVRVITRANLRDVHEAFFAETPKPDGLRFEYFDLPWIFRFYKKGKRFFLVYYYLWQIGIWFRAQRMLRVEPADVLHHLIGGMDWMPSGLALCPGHFIWGPVGSENTHPVILAHLPVKSRLKDRIRLTIRLVMRHLDPFTRVTASRANLILSHTPETLPVRYRSRVRPFVQTGIAPLPSLAHLKTEFTRGDMLKLIYAGELKDWKGAGLALEASLRFFEKHPDANLVVLGDGPMRRELEATAKGHPQGHRVSFLGNVPMARLVDELHDSDIFLYPSFHHGLATVVLQAMLTGLPVVCIEGDATGRNVGQEAGITVALHRDRAPAADIAEALEALAADEPRRAALARSAQEIAQRRFAYQTLARRISEIYNEVARGT